MALYSILRAVAGRSRGFAFCPNENGFAFHRGTHQIHQHCPLLNIKPEELARRLFVQQKAASPQSLLRRLPPSTVSLSTPIFDGPPSDMSHLQTCPTDILDLIKSEIEAPWCGTTGPIPDALFSLAITCKRMAQYTQARRFQSITLRGAERNNALAVCLKRNPTLLQTTIHLVWHCPPREGDEVNQVLDWLSSTTASIVLRSLTAVKTLVLKAMPITVAEWMPHPAFLRLLASVEVLRIHNEYQGNLQNALDLGDFVDLFPRLKDLSIEPDRDAPRPLFGWGRPRRPSVPVPGNGTKFKNSSPTPFKPPSCSLRHFKLPRQGAMYDYRGILRRSLRSMTHRGFFNALESLTIDASEARLATAHINQCAGTLKTLCFQSPWSWRAHEPRPLTPSPPREVKTPRFKRLLSLELVHFTEVSDSWDAETVIPRNLATISLVLQGLGPSCNHRQVSVRFSIQCKTPEDFAKAFISDIASSAHLWKSLDQILSRFGTIRIDVAVFASYDPLKSAVPIPTVVEDLLPQCQTRGVLTVDITIVADKYLYHKGVPLLTMGQRMVTMEQYGIARRALPDGRELFWLPARVD